MIRAHELAPKRPTHETEALRKEEGSHDGKTLSWVATLWGPLHRITVKSKGHVAIPTCSLKVSRKVC